MPRGPQARAAGSAGVTRCADRASYDRIRPLERGVTVGCWRRSPARGGVQWRWTSGAGVSGGKSGAARDGRPDRSRGGHRRGRAVRTGHGHPVARSGVSDFTVVEQSDGVGGTWRDNIYPGSGCDVPSHLYSFSFAPKTDWSRRFAEQPEILDYAEQLRGRRSASPAPSAWPRTVDRAAFDEDGGAVATVGIRGDSRAGADELVTDAVIFACGQLNRPRDPRPARARAPSPGPPGTRPAGTTRL